MNLRDIPRDKILHLAAGALVALAACMVFSTGWAGVAAALIAGCAKEWYDAKHGGTVDFLDTVATVLGGMATAGIYGALP